jgi:hypothetical protein
MVPGRHRRFVRMEQTDGWTPVSHPDECTPCKHHVMVIFRGADITVQAKINGLDINGNRAIIGGRISKEETIVVSTTPRSRLRRVRR